MILIKKNFFNSFLIFFSFFVPILDFFTSSSGFDFVFFSIQSLSTLFEYALLFIFIFILIKKSQSPLLSFFFLTFLYSSCIFCEALKHFFCIKRPDLSNFHSFPSGHMVLSTFSILGIYHFYKKPFNVFIYIFLLLLMAIARILSKKHYVIDVFAGFLLSFVLYYILIILIFPYAKKRIQISFL